MQKAPRLRPWMLVSAAWIFPAIFGAVNRLAQVKLHGWDPATARDLLWSGGDWFLYAFLTPAVFALSARLPITRANMWRRIWLHVAISLAFCVAWASAGQLFQLTLGFIFSLEKTRALLVSGHFGRDWIAWIFTTLPFGVAVYLCITGVEHAVRYFVEASEREVQVARLSEQLAGARFSALQAQLNPHFLFNTLNTIAVRARDGDSAGTVRMVEQLSDMLRRTLNRENVNEVSLDEEIELVRQYLDIERERFPDRLRTEFSVEDGLAAASVPSFAVQHLVENAIRHGIARRSGAGRLIIRSRRIGSALEVSVQDDGAGVDERVPAPSGHGIATTRERLHSLFGADAALDVVPAAGGGTIATLRVPFHLITTEVSHAEG